MDRRLNKNNQVEIEDYILRRNGLLMEEVESVDKMLVSLSDNKEVLITMTGVLDSEGTPAITVTMNNGTVESVARVICIAVKKYKPNKVTIDKIGRSKEIFDCLKKELSYFKIKINRTTGMMTYDDIVVEDNK